MFYVIYEKNTNVVLNWRNDNSAGVDFTADDAISLFCMNSDLSADQVGCFQSETPNLSIAPHQHIIDPETGEVSDNPNYVEPTPEVQPE